jgi:hypothetical protein
MVAPSGTVIRLHDPTRTKLLQQEIWEGSPDTLYDREFVWDMRISSLSSVAHAVWEERLNPQTAMANGMLASYTSWNQEIFNYLMYRISAETDSGKQLLADVMLAVQERSLAMNDGVGLKSFFRDTVAFKTQPQIEQADALLAGVRITLGTSDLHIKRLGTAVNKTLFRMPEHSRGSHVRAYKVMLNALPTECEVQRQMLEQTLGINSVFSTTVTLPPWSTFITHVSGALAAAAHRTGAIMPSAVSNMALAAFVPQDHASAQTALVSTPSIPGQYTAGGGGDKGKGKCFNCGSTDHFSRNCTGKPCDECGTRFCGALRDMPCMITNGVPSGATGVDGKPLNAGIKSRIERIRAAKLRDGNLESANMAIGGADPSVDPGALTLLATLGDPLVLAAGGGLSWLGGDDELFGDAIAPIPGALSQPPPQGAPGSLDNDADAASPRAPGSLNGTPPATADDVQAALTAAEVHHVHGAPDVALVAAEVPPGHGAHSTALLADTTDGGDYFIARDATFATPPEGPMRIFGDNFASVRMANGSSVARAIINEHVRDGEFVFQHVSDPNNPADFLGKWVPPKKFRATVKYIFNLDNTIIQ